MITVTELFDEVELEATFDVCPMAEAIDCPAELASVYAGLYDISLQRCIDTDTRQEYNDITPYQMERLQLAAMKKIK
jgi:hypothetical protein